MIYQVITTERSETDLQNIYQYFLLHHNDPDTGARLADRLMTRIEALQWLPERYRLYEMEPYRSQGLHVMPVGRYLVFYKVDSRRAHVIIHRILYGGMDLAAALHDTEP